MNILYELKNIEYFFDGKRVLSIDNLILEENKIIGFFGPNGSGKSTLFSILSFISKPQNGEIIIDENIKKSVVMLPQNPYLLKRTVFENIAYGLKIRGESVDLKSKVEEALSLVGLDKNFSNRKWNQLSGGEAQRVALASRLILKPKVLILDEPTVGVDTNSAQLIKDAILLAKQKYNTTIFISSHDYTWLKHISDKKIALFQGSLVEHGNINLLFPPWSKNQNGDLVKNFIDGQKIVIPNSKSKKRDSVVIINQSSIKISKFDENNKKERLIATVTSIQKDENRDNLQIEFSICGINFSCLISKNEIQKDILFPGDKVEVFFNLDNVCWM